MNENVRIAIEFSLKFVPKGPINNIPALVQIMAWRRPGAKPLSEPVTVSLLTHIYASLGLNELILKTVIIGKIRQVFILNQMTIKTEDIKIYNIIDSPQLLTIIHVLDFRVT